MKRLVIYFHYDPAGCIDTACRIAVQAVQKYGRVVFVTNGTLTPADRVWVSSPVRAASNGKTSVSTSAHTGRLC